MFSNKHPFLTALSLALGSAIALGLARFSYGLLLPVMREDLDWSYLVAGTMNTANALGYFIGALSSPAMMRRMSVHHFFISSAIITGVFLFLSGCTDQTSLLFIYRVIAGIASAWIFVAGGVLISQLGMIHAHKSGLMLGIFYAGPGLGIVLSSVILPFFNDWGVKISWDHSWQLSWYALGILCLIFTLILVKPISSIPAIPPKPSGDSGTPLKSYVPALMGYFMFGVGYIGYMTFVVALLKQLGLSNSTLNIFYAILGFSVMASSRLWAQMLDRFKGGQSLAILNTLLGVASLIPALIAIYDIPLSNLILLSIFGSGVLFGAVFLSAVASTTAFVKHNMPSSDWVGGITAFTSIFAAGQIIGPTIAGWISDGQGGLARGLLFSGLALLLGGLIATRQKPLSNYSEK
ncbi:YbfB/YjiJ family MFS transporter [Polynucleobacter cosmopolitanus]|uniref:MFS transporter n=1 Tax=Polynucleobacter cosmopolitanus TaxID=351345 RepID=A0A229FSX0_9BURK|nr:YbfB/YjiJ family MFS transporter [Polynucleobacter cosmopolitanus]OXL14509.1 MFS transporter [Polynucleobacter cosmopolitanus]